MAISPLKLYHLIKGVYFSISSFSKFYSKNQKQIHIVEVLGHGKTPLQRYPCKVCNLFAEKFLTNLIWFREKLWEISNCFSDLSHFSPNFDKTSFPNLSPIIRKMYEYEWRSYETDDLGLWEFFNYYYFILFCLFFLESELPCFGIQVVRGSGQLG